MGRIEERFKALKRQGKKAFMPFVTACDPTPEATVAVVAALEAAGADMVELGIAYSDPLADGPVIQDSYARVLDAGRTVEDVLKVVREIRAHSQIPLAGMVSYSIAWKKGLKAFSDAAADAGLDCLIVPDLPPEEARDLIDDAAEDELGIVFLVTPTTQSQRMKLIVEASSPFIYYVSVVGITGAREALPMDLADGVRAVKALTLKPVVVGFGVSSVETATRAAKAADGVIMGSAIVKVVSDNRGRSVADIAKAVGDFAAPIAKAVKALQF